MTKKPSISKPPIDSQWPVPLNAVLRGGLRDKVRQFSDGASNILVPKTPPTSKRTLVTPPGAAGNVPVPPPPVCIPVTVASVVVDPADNPLTLGTSYTFSIFGLTGTTPYHYQWYLNGTLVATTATFVHTLVDGDVVNKDEFGLGEIFIYVVVSNPCGIDSTSTDGSFPAQGNPPP